MADEPEDALHVIAELREEFPELPVHVVAFPVGYLPMECPRCGRSRLEYGTNAAGHVTFVRCEKCGAHSEEGGGL